jgi:hypothetical protein
MTLDGIEGIKGPQPGKRHQFTAEGARPPVPEASEADSSINLSVAWRRHSSAQLKAKSIAILGVSACYQDSAAVLAINGHIVAAAQEERFSR